MRRIQSIFKWMTACVLIVCLGLLAWQCIDIFLDGGVSNVDASAGSVAQMYRFEDVSRRLSALSVPFACTVIMTVVCAFVCRTENKSAKQEVSTTLYQRPKVNAFPVIRSVLLALAMVFVLLGVMNGGLRDVLVKAINICTECIGLG